MTKSPFLTDVAHKMRVMRYAKRTIETYLHWIRAFILFHGKQHPRDLGDEQVERFLSHLVNQRDVSQSTAPSLERFGVSLQQDPQPTPVP